MRNTVSQLDFSMQPGVPVDGPAITVIIPAGGPDRVKLVEQMLINLAAQNYTNLKLVLSEYGLNGTRYFDWFPGKHIYISGGALFNKSKAMNAGLMAADSEICVFLDADLLVPDGFFGLIASRIAEHEACFVLNRILHSSLVEVEHHVLPPIYEIRADNFNGGSLAITKTAYIKIGGMCEQFEGYGYEDVEFWNRLRQLVSLNERRELDVLHLPHDHAEGYDQHWLANQHIWLSLHGEDPAVRADRFRLQLDKYRV